MCNCSIHFCTVLSGVVLIVAVTEQQQQEQMKEKPQQQQQRQHGLIHFLCYAVLHVLYYAECCDAEIVTEPEQEQKQQQEFK